MKQTSDLQEIYNNLKKLLEIYEPEMKVLSDYGSRYELAAKSDYEVRSERTGNIIKKKDPFFCGIIIQSSYVGFYNTGIYMERERFEGESSELIKKTLKGKSCFHIKQYNAEVEKMIQSVLYETYEIYKEKGWIGGG